MATVAVNHSCGVDEPHLAPANLAEWRMTVAAGLLRDTDRTLASIAGEVGYDNEFAFSSAFRRLRGSAPGRYRRVAVGRPPAEGLTSSP